MELKDILDPEEYRAVQWRIENFPDRLYSPEEYVYTRIKEDIRYIEMAEDEKESFLSKVKIFMESQTIDFNDKDSNVMLETVNSILGDINREFNSIFDNE